MPTGIYFRTALMNQHNSESKIGRVGAMTGRKFSEDHKHKISQANKGRILTLEQRKHLSVSHLRNPNRYWLGKKFPKEVKEKISKALRGRTLSAEHIRKIGLANKGEKNPMRRLEVASKFKGDKCHFWKGGITPENQKIRHSVEATRWREAVFSRDNYICQKYGIIGGKITAHHIQKFAEHPELRFEVANGITLSRKAHDEFHKKYGKTNNTKAQLYEFINYDITKIHLAAELS